MATKNNIKNSDHSPKQEDSSSKFSVMSIFATILREIADFKGWELIFKALLFGFIAWAFHSLSLVYQLHISPEYAHIPKYSIYDFKFSLVMVVFFLVYRLVFQRIFYNVLKDRIKLDKYTTDEEKDARIKTVGNWIGSIIYYSFSSGAAFVLFRDQDFFPKILGGSNTNPVNMFKGIPSIQNIPYSVEFYMVQFGCHLHTLIDYCVNKRKAPQFWEMFLHHSMAVFLIFFSYITGGIRVGILVLLMHDPCDVLIYCNRLISEWKNPSKPLQYVSYLVLILVWLFLRLFAFPKVIVGACFDYVLNGDLGIIYLPHLFLTFMLAALVILHAYWFVFILRVLVVMSKGKKNYNIYDTTKKSEKGKEE